MAVRCKSDCIYNYAKKGKQLKQLSFSSFFLSLSLFVLFLQEEHPAVLTNRGSRKATDLLLDIPSLLYYAYWVKFGMRNLFARVFVRVPLAAFLGFGVDYRIASHN